MNNCNPVFLILGGKILQIRLEGKKISYLVSPEIKGNYEDPLQSQVLPNLASLFSQCEFFFEEAAVFLVL